MSHVFISYQQDDFDFAQVLIHNLEKSGFDTWIDDHLQGGEDWRVEIDLAIKSAFALVVIMSPSAKFSEYVAYEWSFALGSNVKVIPVMLKSVGLHPRLETLHFLDFTSLRNRPWDKLVEAIKGASHEDEVYTLHIPPNTPPYIKQAIMTLDSPSHLDRENAISVLVEAKHSIAQQALIRALQHPLSDVRSKAAGALGQIRDASAVPTLIDVLKDPEPRVRSEVAEALGQIGDASAVPALINAAKDPDALTRRYSSEALCRIKDIRSLPTFIELLEDKDFFIRKIAVDAIYETRDASAMLALVNVIKDSDVSISCVAIKALGMIKDIRALPPLIGFLREIVELEITIETSKTKKRSKFTNLFLSRSTLSRRSDIIEAIKNYEEIAIPCLEEILQDSHESDSFRKLVENILAGFKKV